MKRTLIVLAALVLALGVLAGNGVSGAKKPDKQGKRLLHKVKAATAKYHSVNRALAAGYVAPPVPAGCVESPMGAMGYHFENPALMQDSVLNPRRPEILLYERKRNGKFRLIGVEYYMEADRTATTPVLFGQAFQGPMPAHHPGMETHYDLHVWLWKKNPSGLFAEWNPRVSCP